MGQGIREKNPPGTNSIAREFLDLLKNLRWVILQDSAVLIAVYKRNHFIFNHQSDVFDSIYFKDFQIKLQSHIKKHKSMKEETIKNGLPGVLKNYG